MAEPAAIAPRIVEVLRCPACGGPLRPAPGSLRCGNGHSFDLARQGYVNLLSAGGAVGQVDTAAMVQARAEFLESGQYEPVTAAVAELSAASTPGRAVVLDAGAGTGHYLAAVLDRLPDAVGLAMDASKYALRRAARSHPRAAAVGWDVWRPLPVRDGAVDLVLNVFAPRNGPEFRRVLRSGGALFVVTPAARHLAELVGPLGLLGVDARKEERLERALSTHFILQRQRDLEFPLTLDAEAVRQAVGMGPSAWHVEPAELEARIGALDLPVRTSASVRLLRYVARSPRA